VGDAVGRAVGDAVGRPVGGEGVGRAVGAAVSRRQRESHPSPAIKFPSSHSSSAPLIIPSPQTALQIGTGMEVGEKRTEKKKKKRTSTRNEKRSEVGW
jgi:hypothetical protein